MQTIETFSIRRKEKSKMMKEVNNAISRHRLRHKKWTMLGMVQDGDTVEVQCSCE